MKEQKTYYYSDELNDEFSEAKIEARVIDENYKYLHKNIFWNLAHFLVQNVLSVPLKILYAKIKFRIKYVGKEKLKNFYTDRHILKLFVLVIVKGVEPAPDKTAVISESVPVFGTNITRR